MSARNKTTSIEDAIIWIYFERLSLFIKWWHCEWLIQSVLLHSLQLFLVSWVSAKSLKYMEDTVLVSIINRLVI